jgi:hypothetical protein
MLDFNAEVNPNQISYKDTYYILYREILIQENIEPYAKAPHLSRLHYISRYFYEYFYFFQEIICFLDTFLVFLHTIFRKG